jgi:hypothetical protein
MAPASERSEDSRVLAPTDRVGIYAWIALPALVARFA